VFGNYRNATVEVTKYHDLDADGGRDQGEPALSGWEITLGSETKTTGVDGKATFSVKPGSARTVCETLKTGWHNSDPGSDTNPCKTVPADELDSNEKAEPVLGNYQDATLSGVKFEDQNTNGTKDSGDGGLNGWKIKAYKDVSGNGSLEATEITAVPAASATTATLGGVAGSYSLSLKPGAKYVVCEELQAGWQQSAPSPSNEKCKAGAPTLANGGHATDALTSGQPVNNLNFGNYQRGTVSGSKFEDKNSSGSQDSGEGGLGHWTIKAYTDDGNGTLSAAEGGATAAGSTTTAGDGTYSLSLTPGNYVICEAAQTNWTQTKPAGNTRCQNASGAAPGGYAVTVSPGSTTAAQDFGNARFDSTSTLTDSAFKLVDDLTPWTITDFEILLNPKNVIVATNPGQFYYHQRATNTSGGTSYMHFDIDWPCKFQAQTTGGQPLHAYVQLPGDAPNTWRDWTPTSSNIWWTTSDCPAGPDGTIRVNDVPAGARVWVTVHLDYALKGTTAPSASFGNPPIPYKPFQSTARTTGGASYSSGSLIGRGKKVTVVYGQLVNKANGTPMPNVWLRMVQGANSAATSTEVDGSFVFFDSQACSDDGIVKCAGTAGAWNFAVGNNVASKLEVLGDGAYQTSVLWPTGKNNAVVYSGNQTFATLTTAPSFAFNISKNSAYNRDWKLGP
jgi:hypothetical protein